MQKWDDLSPDQQRDPSCLATLEFDELERAISAHFNAVEAIQLSRSIFLGSKIRAIFENLPGFQAWTRQYAMAMPQYQERLEAYLLAKDLVRGRSIVFQLRDSIHLDRLGVITYQGNPEAALLARAALDEAGITYKMGPERISFAREALPGALYMFMHMGFRVAETDDGTGKPFPFEIKCQVCGSSPNTLYCCGCCLVVVCSRACQTNLHP